MRLIARIATYAGMVGLESLKFEGPSHMFHAGDYGLMISDWAEPGGMASTLAEVSLVFGLSRGLEPGDTPSLKLHYNRILGRCQLEHDLKGFCPPSEIGAIAERFGLTSPKNAVLLVDESALEVGFVMVDFIVKAKRRHDPFRSLPSSPPPAP